MSQKIRIFIFCFLCFFCSNVSAQSEKQIRNEKEKCEKEISYLNKLLSESDRNKSVSLGKLKILQEKIAQSEKLLSSLNKELNVLQSGINSNERRIAELEREKRDMLQLYDRLIYNSWKNRNKTNKLMFIFSSSDFNQAYNRFKYFQQSNQYSKRQLDLIRQLSDSLYLKNQTLKNLVDSKNKILLSISENNRELEKERTGVNNYIAQLRKNGKALQLKLKKEEQKRQKLAKDLSKLIAAQNKSSGSGSSSKYRMTPEEKLVSDNFYANKGKLPWPVNQGLVVRKFGLHPDALHSNVKLFSDGIDILTLKDADIRAVFQGTVTLISYNFSTNYVVFIRHGDYVSIYINVVDLKVKKGDKVNTKDVIGKVGYDSENGSILFFQIWKNQQKEDPQLWLAK